MTVFPRTAPTLKGRVEVTAEERDLIRRMRAGEEEAFEEFAKHYIPGLYRFAANRLRNEPELTRDVVQTTVCKVIEKLDSFRGEAPLFVWLYACCRNEIAAHYRQKQSQPVFAAIDDQVEPSADVFADPANPELQLLQHESENMVHLTLDHLPPKYASVLQWKYLEGESVDEIARRLALSAKAAESVLTRARNAFRSTYEDLAEVNR